MLCIREHPISHGLIELGQNKLAACHDVACSRSRVMPGGGKKLELKDLLALAYHPLVQTYEDD